MGAKLNEVIVVDVEATCWDKTDASELQNNQPSEVIEIGWAKLNLTEKKVIKKGSVIIKPRYSKVSKFCTQLTGWAQGDLDRHGVDIVDGLKQFAADSECTKQHIWFACGEYDRWKLSSVTGKQGVGLYGISYEDNPFDNMRSFYNIKTLFALKHNLKKEMGLDRMLNYCGHVFDGRPHNGQDDAINISKIVLNVLT
jgi:inhibitor of KinA sporulation pathway (predicted exonuclease)